MKYAKNIMPNYSGEKIIFDYERPIDGFTGQIIAKKADTTAYKPQIKHSLKMDNAHIGRGIDMEVADRYFD